MQTRESSALATRGAHVSRTSLPITPCMVMVAAAMRGKRSLILVMALLRLCSHLCSLQYDLHNDESYAPHLHLHMGLTEHGMLDG